jgi:hypothetical protein
MVSAIANFVRGTRDIDRRLKEEEKRHQNIVKEYADRLNELKRLSQVLAGEIPEEASTDKETPWIYLNKNNFVESVRNALKNPEKK